MYGRRAIAVVLESASSSQIEVRELYAKGTESLEIRGVMPLELASPTTEQTSE